MIVRAREPLRLGLAGGGTDVSPFSDQHGGYVMNVTIDKFAYATLDPSPDGKAEFHAMDGDCVEALVPNEVDLRPGALQLMKGVYRRVSSTYLRGESPAFRCSARLWPGFFFHNGGSAGYGVCGVLRIGTWRVRNCSAGV
jgi:D-glycero-alpha-D-manno-heptose-7-phosphate kinase